MGRRKTISRLAVVGVTLACIACDHVNSVMLPLRDRIEDEASNLQWSTRSEATLRYPIHANQPWYFVVSTTAGVETGTNMTSRALERIRASARTFSDSAVLGFATPTTTSVAKCPSNVTVSKQIVLHGEAGSAELVVVLSHVGERVELSRVTVQPASQ